MSQMFSLNKLRLKFETQTDLLLAKQQAKQSVAAQQVVPECSIQLVDAEEEHQDQNESSFISAVGSESKPGLDKEKQLIEPK